MSANLLVEVVENVNFFRDKNDQEAYFVEFVNGNGVRVFAPLDSGAFRSFLYAKSYELTGGEEVLEPKSAIIHLRCLLEYYKSYEQVSVYRRVFGNLEEGIEYDLQGSSQKSVKITSEGWEISDKKEHFVTPKISLPQVEPIHTTKSPMTVLKPFVNLEGDMFTIFVIWLIQSFTYGKHHALLISADRGSGKSSLSKMIAEIISPCKFKVVKFPDRKDDLYTLLYNSFLCCFDNLSGDISNDESDILCGAITGTSVVKRSLYTNSEVTVANLSNIIVFNGIDFIPKRDDLLERMLVLKLKKLKPNQLKRDGDLEKEFKIALPEILGSIFNTLSKAMNELDTDNDELARMTDSFFEMIAIAKALGISEEEFRKMYAKNKAELEIARLNSPLVEAIKEYMSSVASRKVQGKAQQILTAVRNSYSGDKNLLPKSASHFTKQIEKEHENLFKNGFRINIDDTSANGTDVSIIRLKK